MASILTYPIPFIVNNVTYRYNQTIYVNPAFYDYMAEQVSLHRENMNLADVKSLFQDNGMFFKMSGWRPGNIDDGRLNTIGFTNVKLPPFMNEVVSDADNTFYQYNGNYASVCCGYNSTGTIAGGTTPLGMDLSPATQDCTFVFAVVKHTSTAEMLYDHPLTVTLYVNESTWEWRITASFSQQETWGDVLGHANQNTLNWFDADYDPSGKYDDDPDNPYAGGGSSVPGGGNPDNQNWNPDSDYVTADPLPDETTFGAQASGIVTIFVPSDIQLRNLAEMLFSSDFFSYFVKELTGISDLFISLGMVPFTIVGSPASITFLDYVSVVVPGKPGLVVLDKAPKQFFEFDMGYINMASDSRVFRSDSCLDYSPYCKLGIFLPFIGYQELNIDECRNSIIHLIYRIDILSGSCIALLELDGRTVYQFSGNCLTQLPITSADAGSVITNAVNIGIAAASAGATGAIASAGDALTAERLANESLSAAGAELQHAQHAGQVANAQGSLSSATANGVMGMKPNFKKTGAVGASNSMIGVMQPYLFLETPNIAVPENYEKYCGFPSNLTGKLGDFSGYTVVDDIRLNNLVALSPEVEEIYKLLKSGIIV